MNAVFSSFANRYSRPGLWSLFLICAFPLHVWTIILFLRDVSWLSERTNLWDAIGVGAYGLLYAFVESVLVFVVVALLGLFLTPRHWAVEKRISFLSLLVLILSVWGMIAQLLFLWKVFPPDWVVGLLIRWGRPLMGLYLISLSFVVPSVVLPVYLFLRSEGMTRSIREFNERLAPLMTAYLVLDLAGLIIVIIRNAV